MVRLSINFIFSLIEAGLMLGIAWSVLSKRFNEKVEYPMFFILIIIGAIGINYIDVNIMVRIFILMGIFLVFCHLLFSDPVHIKIFYLLLGIYINVASEMVVANIVLILPEKIVKVLLNNVAVETVFSILIKLLVLLCGICFTKYIIRLQPELPRTYWLILDIIFAAFIEVHQLCLEFPQIVIKK